MAFQIEQLPDTGVLVVRGSGEGSVAEAEAILGALRERTTPGTRARILFDIRAVTWRPSPAEARQIGERYGLAGAEHGYRMAYLAPPGAQYGIARMVEILSGFQGAKAAVFADEAEALAWLRAGAADAG